MGKASKLLGGLKHSARIADSDDDGQGVQWLPLPSLGFNVATGGGIPQGRLVEFLGEFSSGKSHVAYEALAETQKQGGLAVLIDGEMVFDVKHGTRLGIDTKELAVYPGELKELKDPEKSKKAEIKARSVEAVSAFMEEIIMNCRSVYDMSVPVTIVVDSITALTTIKQSEEDMDKSTADMTKAKALGQMYNRIVGLCKKRNITVIFINQLREKITANKWEEKEKGTGGRGLEFYASLRISFRKAGFADATKNIKGGKVLDMNEIKVGQVTRIEVIKNKVYPPYNKGLIMLHFNRFDNIWGSDRMFGLVGFLKDERIITSGGGGWMSYGEEKLGQGEAKVEELLEDNPELLEKIFNEVGIPLSN